MKNLIISILLVSLSSLAYSQSGEKPAEEKKPATEKSKPEESEKGHEIKVEATSTEGSKEKGLSISSAARRSGLPANRNSSASESSNEAKEAGKSKGAENAQANQPNLPENTGRPAGVGNGPVVIPSARPLPPVVRPGGPANPGNRPPVRPPVNRPPAGRPPGN